MALQPRFRSVVVTLAATKPNLNFTSEILKRKLKHQKNSCCGSVKIQVRANGKVFFPQVKNGIFTTVFMYKGNYSFNIFDTFIKQNQSADCAYSQPTTDCFSLLHTRNSNTLYPFLIVLSSMYSKHPVLLLLPLFLPKPTTAQHSSFGALYHHLLPNAPNTIINNRC